MTGSLSRFSNWQMIGSLILFLNFKEWKEPSQFKLVKKICIDRKSNSLFTLGSESETMVCFLGLALL